MRLFLLGALLCASATSVAAPDRAIPPSRPSADMPVIDPNAAAPATCPPTSRYDAARRGGRLDAQKLAELPVADHYRAVYRTVGGCEVPLIAGYAIGTTQR